MKVGAAIYSMLKDDSAVSALVGTRIYPELAEEGAVTPYVVYSVVSNTPVDTKESAPVDEAQLEVFSVADTYAAANDLADKVRAALSRQSRTVFSTVTVQSVRYTNEVTEVSAERNMFISVQDYTARLTPVINLLLQQYGGAHAAYSLRRLNANYTGSAIRIIRDSDLAEQDIGFDANGNLDTAAALAFCPSQYGRIKIFYDQSGNGNDTTQNSQAGQPILIEQDNTYIAVDNQPALRFFGADDILPFNSTGLDIGNLSSFLVCKLHTTSGGHRPLTLSGPGGLDRWYSPQVGGDNFVFNYNDQTLSTSANTNNNLHTMIAGATQGNAQAFVNTSSLGTMTLDSGIDTVTTGIGGISNAFFNGFIQEVIVYASDQSANRTGIESNIMTHYSIT